MGNFGRFCFRNNGDHFFEKSQPIALQRAFQKNNGEHFGGEILAHSGDHLFHGRMTFFFKFKVWGGGGGGGVGGGGGSWSVSH